MAAPRKKVEPKKEEVKVEVVEEKLPTEKKYRYQFDSYEEYYAYKGPKG